MMGMNKCAVITGSQGFIGWQVVKELIWDGYDVYALTRYPKEAEIRWNKDVEITCARPRFIHFSDTDIDATYNALVKEGIEKRRALFFHFAWDGSAGRKRTEYKEQLKNITMALKCVDMAAKMKCSAFIGAGSIMEDDCIPFVDDFCMSPPPSYMYSEAKLAAHLMCQTQAAIHGLSFKWGKISNAYGEGDTTGRFVNTLLNNMRNNKLCELSNCAQFYDFVYISDVAKAFRLIGEKGKDNNAYYIGSLDVRKLKYFVEEIRNIVNSKSKVEYGIYPDPQITFPESYFNVKPLMNDTGFYNMVSFDAGIRRTLKWMEDNDG